MRIGIYTPYLDTLAGGERYILTLASYLSKNNSVSLFWDRDRDAVKKRIVDKFEMDLSDVTFVDNIFDKNVTFLKRFLASKAYDRIIVLSDGSIPLIWSKLILHFQTPMEWVQVSGIKTKIKLSRVYEVICNSAYTKQYIDKEFSVKSDIIYPPVTIQNTKHIQKENIILNVGRYGIVQAGSSYKKQEILIDTFKKLVDGGIKNWKFILIVSIFEQDKEKLATMQNMIGDYPIEIISNPSNDILWQMYEKSRIYWHASGYGEDLQAHPDRAEHFGMSTVEAMGTGAVPVVINAGGQPEIVEDGKNGFLWETTENLLEKTKELTLNNSLWISLSENAKKRAEAFSKEIFIRCWEKAIV